MRPVLPHFDEHGHVVFIELENAVLHDVVNGMIFGLVATAPLLAFFLVVF